MVLEGKDLVLAGNEEDRMGHSSVLSPWTESIIWLVITQNLHSNWKEVVF